MRSEPEFLGPVEPGSQINLILKWIRDFLLEKSVVIDLLVDTYVFPQEKSCSSPLKSFFTSVADPNLPDPHVFGPPGSGSISERYGSESGSGSFCHQAKILRKTLIPTTGIL